MRPGFDISSQGGDVMEKKSGNGNRSGKRVVRDLPSLNAATPDVKGAFSVLSSALNRATGEVITGVGKALQIAARGK
jgi:hypothetical protein